MTDVPMRETARLASVQELSNGEYIVQEGWKPNYVKSGERKLSRVNIMGVIVDKQSPYEFMIDDGTGVIGITDFNHSKASAKVKVGDPVLIIGRPRLVENTVFIASEIVATDQLKKRPEWLSLRKHAKVTPKIVVQEEELVESTKNMTGEEVINFIRDHDDGEGCPEDNVILYFGEDAHKVIDTLVAMGEIYHIKPSVVKVLE